jgi:hypothetical protein
MVVGFTLLKATPNLDSSDRGPSAIDDQGSSRNVARSPGSQECGGSYYLPGLAEALLSDPAHRVLVPCLIFHDLPDQGRGEVSGSEGIHLDIVGSELQRENLGELQYRSLARRVSRVPNRWPERSR